jgi:putative ABC transport system substrate-binding protein
VKRRTGLIILCAGAVTFTPVSMHAQPASRSVRVALLFGGVQPQGPNVSQQAFVQTLRELGWVEGVNLQLHVRYGQGTAEGMAKAASDVAAAAPDVIVSAGTQPVGAVRRATSTIPIVMAGAGDPVGSGLVQSLAKPGGNITGLSLMGQEIIPKALSLLHEVVPQARRIDLLGVAANAAFNAFAVQIWADAVRRLGIEGQLVELRGLDDIESAIAGSRADAILMLPDPIYTGAHQQRIASAAIKRRLPLGNSGGRSYARAGALLTYSVNQIDLYRQAAVYADRILRGAKPAEMPVEQPSRYELIVNLKTAKAIGITVPQSVLLRADEVIE